MKFFKKDPSKKIEKEKLKIENELKRLKEKKETKGAVTKNLKNIRLTPGGRYIGRDSGVYLMWTVIISILIIIGIVIFFNEKFTNLNEEFDGKVEELEKTYSNLKEKESLLNETSAELEIKSSREDKLSKEFTSVNTRKEELEQENEELKDEVSRLENDLEVANEEIVDLERKNDALRDKIEKLEGGN